MAAESEVKKRMGYIFIMRSVVIVILLIVGSVLFTAYGGDEPEPIDEPAAEEDRGLMGPRMFNSEMPLAVWTTITAGEKWKDALPNLDVQEND